MPKNDSQLNFINRTPNWLTIQEAVDLIKTIAELKINDFDIYRQALYGNIYLSIYFQSPIVLRKVHISKHKVNLRPTRNSLIDRLCLLERHCFISSRNLTISTEGKYIYPLQRIIDTPLMGYEYVFVQRLLAYSLHIPPPIDGVNNMNYGISVIINGELFQVFEQKTWRERIQQQKIKLPEDIAQHIEKYISYKKRHQQRWYFPIHNLPQDACFVIQHSELEKLINIFLKNKTAPATSTRISTPLSRMFWLACKNNETISPLIKQPYKLLSIFEQWASEEGITERFSGDTLKTALERGSPPVHIGTKVR
ncbi:hypothetical protein ACF3VQ_12775 [Yersinia sp. HM-2024]|uniref:hypothetical protein n=1 Tax=Yersinia sp. HM-2024 TaxID=3344550 RepID=UPI00370D520F